MCGIAGFVGAGERADIERMSGRLAHRGPDAAGHWGEPGVWLGHRRLAIVDIAGGSQPMATADGALRIVFNGEIYNAAELRKELEAAGRIFRTDHSDTEVLLEGYREWGEALIPKLNGMWALALWDSVRRRLFLSRDRFGKKPLFWFCRGETFAFASELKALMGHPQCPRSVSSLARAKFFAHALIPAPHTMLEGVGKLPGGHNLVFEPGATPRVVPYWKFRIEPDDSLRDEDALAGRLRELLDAAVRRRLISDVPLGVFLSGGVDSSAVAALAVRHHEGLRTFSVGFREPTFDESSFAARVARELGTAHTTETLDLASAREMLPGLLAAVDEPQGDNSLLPTWLLCGFTRRHVTVALGGDGGDELFAGYDTFRGLHLAAAYARWMPAPLHAGVRALIARLPVSHANLSLDFKLKRGMRGASYPERLWNPVWLGALEPGEIEEFTGFRGGLEELFSEAVAVWDDCGTNDLVDRTLEFYTRIYLQDGILPKVDRASMLHSLEARSPLLDCEVAEFARRLPHRFKLRGGITKFLLKRALRGLLPEEIIHRKKKGFGSPVGAWFQEGLLAPSSRDAFTQRRYAAHRAGRADERLFLWCQLAFEGWESSLPPPPP